MTDDPCQESGPFCRHWGDPADCDEKCATCGHECCEHDQSGDGEPSECNHFTNNEETNEPIDCECENYTEQEN